MATITDRPGTVDTTPVRDLHDKDKTLVVDRVETNSSPRGVAAPVVHRTRASFVATIALIIGVVAAGAVHRCPGRSRCRAWAFWPRSWVSAAWPRPAGRTWPARETPCSACSSAWPRWCGGARPDRHAVLAQRPDQHRHPGQRVAVGPRSVVVPVLISLPLAA